MLNDPLSNRLKYYDKIIQLDTKTVRNTAFNKRSLNKYIYLISAYHSLKLKKQIKLKYGKLL